MEENNYISPYFLGLNKKILNTIIQNYRSRRVHQYSFVYIYDVSNNNYYLPQKYGNLRAEWELVTKEYMSKMFSKDSWTRCGDICSEVLLRNNLWFVFYLVCGSMSSGGRGQNATLLLLYKDGSMELVSNTPYS